MIFKFYSRRIQKLFGTIFVKDPEKLLFADKKSLCYNDLNYYTQRKVQLNQVYSGRGNNFCPAERNRADGNRLREI